MTVFYNMRCAAIILTCIFIISIITYKVECSPDWAYVISVISGVVALILWLGVFVFIVFCVDCQFKYERLLEDKIKVERTVEKYLIDHPELRELEIDEYGKIKEDGGKKKE